MDVTSSNRSIVEYSNHEGFDGVDISSGAEESPEVPGGMNLPEDLPRRIRRRVG